MREKGGGEGKGRGEEGGGGVREVGWVEVKGVGWIWFLNSAPVVRSGICSGCELLARSPLPITSPLLAPSPLAFSFLNPLSHSSVVVSPPSAARATCTSLVVLVSVH